MDYEMLVNRENLLASDYVPDGLIEIHEPTGSKLDKTFVNRLNETAYAFFKLMQKAAKEEGYEIFIDSSYRTYDYQKNVFDNYEKKLGYEETYKRVAPPGGSEHQTGLAFDVISRRNGQMIEESSEEDPELIWMKENAYKFGYILRYPKGKEDITGFTYERWHYRFVGPEIAQEMHEKGIQTLEEYHMLKKEKRIDTVKYNLNTNDYLMLIREVFEEVINEYKTEENKDIFEELFLDIAKKLLEVRDEDYNTIFEFICDEYLESVKAIAKLSPGLSTGLYDEKENIVLNTYNGKMSDIPNDDDVTISTVFDASSMTKMFTSILLLKEEEKGKIDLNRNFSDYSPILQNIDIPIIDVLRFGYKLLTDGRLDEPGLSKEEREERFKSTYIAERNTFLYSDIPYMLVPLLFGKNMEDATENYLKHFYELFRDEIGLSETGYSTINMTGGSVDIELMDENLLYRKTGLYDPKANILENEVGYVSGHAGVTTTVTDLEKLFRSLANGLLSKKSLEKLVTTVQPESKILLDKEGKPVLRNGNTITINRGMGVYINTGSIRACDIPARYSQLTFAAAGSTGTNSIFDLENGFNAIYLSNIRSGLFSRTINTDNYTYGDDNDEMPKNYETTVLNGTHYFKEKYSPTDPKGALIREDGSYMTYVRATNNFKEECLDTLLKLRIAKKVLIRKAQLQYSGSELQSELENIEMIFANANNMRETSIKRNK